MKQLSPDRPGIREQQLLRKMRNPVFGEAQRKVGKDDLAQARLQDGLEKDRFLSEFQTLVQKAVDLQPNAPSETVLKIKDALDRSYQLACALPGDMTSIKQSIIRLVDVIMQAIRTGAGNDLQAQQQLMEEAIARKAHYELQEIPLVAALMHPESPVAADELIPSLLSESEATLEATLSLFDEQQLATIVHDGRTFLARQDPDHALPDAWARLQLIEAVYRQLNPSSAPN